MAPNPEGKASGYAFACFQKDDEARKAMHRNKNYVGKRYIELILSSQTEMEKILKEGVRMQRREDFVENNGTLGDKNEKKPNSLRENGRSTRGNSRRSRSRSPIRVNRSGEGFRGRIEDYSGADHVNGARPAGFYERVDDVAAIRGDVNRRGREKDKKRDSDSRGGLNRSSGRDKEGRERCARSGVTRRESENRGRRENLTISNNNRNRHESTGVDGTPVGNSTWVVITGLPYTVTEVEVIEFFKGLDVVNVHFMLHTAGNWVGKKNGTAYVEFRSVGDCIQGIDRNRQFIRKAICWCKALQHRRCTGCHWM